MKKILLSLILACFALSMYGQGHGMKYYFDDEYECWNLEDSTSFRTDMPVIQPDGTPGDPRTALAINETGNLDLILVKFILGPILHRYEDQGLERFGMTYIILPNGRVDEVSFSFSRLGHKKLDITEEDMLYWRQLSDALKEWLRYSIPNNVQRLQFYRMCRFVNLAKLENVTM